MVIIYVLYIRQCTLCFLQIDGGGRTVLFDEKIESIPSNDEILESDEDAIFVGELGDDGTDPFVRESIFRKSMKKLYHTPFDPKR